MVKQAVEQLVSLIEQRELRESDSLPSMAELAAELGVSRPVVREAIAELAGQGLVERHQGRATVVATADTNQMARLMRMRFLVGGRDEQALREYCAIIAVAATRLAAQRATPADVDGLAQWLERLRDPDSNLRAAEHGFFRQLGRTTGNELMVLTFESLGPLVAGLVASEPNRRQDRGWLVDICGQILAAINAGDPDAAVAAMGVYVGEAAGAETDLDGG